MPRASSGRAWQPLRKRARTEGRRAVASLVAPAHRRSRSPEGVGSSARDDTIRSEERGTTKLAKTRLLTLELEGGRPAAFSFLRSLQIAHNAVSLGGVESLACHPRTTTHSELSPEQLDRAGISEGMVRLSVGVENWHDLLHDF